jgi:NADPH:quinone reductase-like Zn-dependent oxidoreductase
MKAIVCREYGSPDVLRCEEVERPTPGDDEVLIRVRAASVNPFDWHFMRGRPYLIRAMSGLRRPKDIRVGVDVAGQIESVGRNVKRLRAGDEVFGECRGAFAEYACTPESSLVLKPDNVTFEQAASVGIAGLTALQGLRDKGGIKSGQKVLINGASGGVGTFAVQIAESYGAEVTGVCSTRNVEMVRSIGAGHVIDYTREDFAESGPRYDLILDCYASHSLGACRRALAPKGTYVMVGGPDQSMVAFLGRLAQASLLSGFSSQKLCTFVAKNKNEDLTVLRELLAAGKLAPVIDRQYRLSEVPDAIRYLGKGHARGKVVIALEDDDAPE